MKGRLNTGKLLLREIAEMVVTDAQVQETLLKQARNGTLHPSVMVALFWTHGGRPVSSVEIRQIEDSRPAGLTIQQQQNLLRALPPAEFVKFARMMGVAVPASVLAQAGIVEAPIDVPAELAKETLA